MLKRADVLLCDLGLTASREQAQRLIAQGVVLTSQGQNVRKAAQKFDEKEILTLAKEEKYVSRGAYKLENLIEKYAEHVQNAVAVDIGASTGGFTDLLLQNGAKKVYAIDCGHAQLHEKLRADSRVINFEKYNARMLKKSDFKPLPSLAVMDVSFISVTLLIPALDTTLKPDALIFILIKPQFEAGRAHIGKKGVVKDVGIQLQCVQDVTEFAQKNAPWILLETAPSPIKGPEGNQEYVAVFRKEKTQSRTKI